MKTFEQEREKFKARLPEGTSEDLAKMLEGAFCCGAVTVFTMTMSAVKSDNAEELLLQVLTEIMRDLMKYGASSIA